jgi:hypothetical protein
MAVATFSYRWTRKNKREEGQIKTQTPRFNVKNHTIRKGKIIDITGMLATIFTSISLVNLAALRNLDHNLTFLLANHTKLE